MHRQQGGLHCPSSASEMVRKRHYCATPERLRSLRISWITNTAWNVLRVRQHRTSPRHANADLKCPSFCRVPDGASESSVPMDSPLGGVARRSSVTITTG